MDFTLSAEVTSLSKRVGAFIRDEVIPLELSTREDGHLDSGQLVELRRKARAAALFGPQLPRQYGGLELAPVALCAVFEQAGRSLLGPAALHCAAPDEGNMHLLERFATAAQRERYLRPLAEGTIRSCFCMTEPAPGCGSDPSMLQTRATRIDGGWEINGHKWFITGALEAAVAITMAVTDPDAKPRRGATLFLVPTGTPGFEIIRDVRALGAHGPGGHCEIRLTAVRVSDNDVLGGVGEGFKIAQIRLGPARLSHCMRWLGAAQRSLEIAASRAIERRAFGKTLSEHQAVQWMLADSEIELHASRLMVLHAAWKLERGEDIRRESSICKVFVAEAVCRIIDRAVQICGALGVSEDTPLERFYREARAFRIYDGASEVHRMVIARSVLEKQGSGVRG